MVQILMDLHMNINIGTINGDKSVPDAQDWQHSLVIGILDHPTFVKTLLENLLELFVTAGYW